MKLFLQSQGLEIWEIMKNSFAMPEDMEEPIDPTERRKFVQNSKAMCAILGGLIGTDFVKVMHYKSAKEIWDKLKNIYEGDDKVKKAKIQTHKRRFEQLTMKEEEDNAGYLQRVDEVVNTMRGLGEVIEESKVVEKVLRSLPTRFDSKVSTIKEIKDLNTLNTDALHGILTAYEMRTKPNNLVKGEATFKTFKKKIHKTNPNHSSDDEEEAHFTKGLQRGTCKYKGKLPFKCFNYGEVGHFASKFPYKNGSNEKDEPTKTTKRQNWRPNKGKFFKKKNNLYSKEENESSSDEDSDNEEFLFIGIDQPIRQKTKEIIEEEMEEKVDYEGELIIALDDLQFEREKNINLQIEVDQLKERIENSDTSNQKVLQLKRQLEECKEITNLLIKQIQEKNKIIKKLETKIASARSNNHNSNRQKDSSQILEDIINSQKPHSNKSGLGFNSNTSDKAAEIMTRSYKDALRDPPSQETHPQRNDSTNTWRLPANKRTIADLGYRHKECGDRNDWR